jgi:DNA-binding XRE family transcriptional regulator
MESIGSRVKWARELRGLTQAALAKAACVLTSSIVDLEAGTRDRPRDLASLAFALGVRPAWLEDGKGDWQAARPGSDAVHQASESSGLARTCAAVSVGDAIVELGTLLSTLSPLARASIAPLLLQLADDPALAARAAVLANAIAQSDGTAHPIPDARMP